MVALATHEDDGHRRAVFLHFDFPLGLFSLARWNRRIENRFSHLIDGIGKRFWIIDSKADEENVNVHVHQVPDPGVILVVRCIPQHEVVFLLINLDGRCLS